MTLIIASALISTIFYVVVRIAAEAQAQARDEAEAAAEQAEYEQHLAGWAYVKPRTTEERAFAEFVASRS